MSEENIYKGHFSATNDKGEKIEGELVFTASKPEEPEPEPVKPPTVEPF